MSKDVITRALAEMQMPEYGVGTAWPTEDCPFCAWGGEPDRMTASELQGHAENCPVRLARIACGMTAPVGNFTTEHDVSISQGQRQHGPDGDYYKHYQASCGTCKWRGVKYPKDGTEEPWKRAGVETQEHRDQTRQPADGMGLRDRYVGIHPNH